MNELLVGCAVLAMYAVAASAVCYAATRSLSWNAFVGAGALIAFAIAGAAFTGCVAYVVGSVVVAVIR